MEQHIRAALGIGDGYILDWRWVGGCQLVSNMYRQMLSCPYREAKFQCEVVGPHKEHRWSEHLKDHERLDNGWPCSEVEFAGPRAVRFVRVGF